jgi:subfamily B ATP-binding cassette protein MsbA
MTRQQLYMRLMNYLGPYWDALLLALVGMIAMSAGVPMLAALIQPLFDNVLAARNPELLQLILLGIIGLFVLRGLAGYIGVYTMNWVASKLAADLRDEMFDKLMMLPLSVHSNHPDGSHISKITSWSAQVGRAFVDVGTVAVKDTLTVIGLLAWLFYLDWSLAILALMIVAVLLLIMQLIDERLRQMGLEAGQAMEGLARVLRCSVQNFRVVKLHGAEQHESTRVREQTDSTHRFFMKRITIASLFIPSIQTGFAVGLSFIIYMVAQQVVAGEITVGGFASFIAALLMLFLPAKRIADVQKILDSGLGSVQNIFLLLDEDVEPDTGTIVIERARGELRFEGVSYCLPEKSLKVRSQMNIPPTLSKQELEACSDLREFNLMLRSGETVALVGSPASTAAIASMVPRFVDPTAGRILLDGIDLRSISLASLRANIASVTPHLTLVSDTIAANIAYGRRARATEAQITAAVHAAQVSEFIRKMPQGLQTIVGEAGVDLTKGQRLRIIIARALLQNAPVLILDEAFGTIDPDSISYVQAALDKIMHGRTTLVIANRLSTLEKADRVVLLDKGRIVECGQHLELLARDGAYTRFARFRFSQARS